MDDRSGSSWSGRVDGLSVVCGCWVGGAWLTMHLGARPGPRPAGLSPGSDGSAETSRLASPLAAEAPAERWRTGDAEFDQQVAVVRQGPATTLLGWLDSPDVRSALARFMSGRGSIRSVDGEVMAARWSRWQPAADVSDALDAAEACAIARRAAAEARPASTSAWLAQLSEHHSLASVRRLAERALVIEQVGSREAMARAAAICAHPEVDVRLAARLLALDPDSPAAAAIDALIDDVIEAARRHPHHGAAQQAIDWLLLHRPLGAVPRLLAELAPGPLRAYLIEGSTRRAMDVDLLTARAAHPHEPMAADIYRMLAERGGAGAEAALLEGLRHAQWAARIAAARGLGRVGRRASLAPLRAARRRAFIGSLVAEVTRESILAIEARLDVERGGLSVLEPEPLAGRLSASDEAGGLSAPDGGGGEAV